MVYNIFTYIHEYEFLHSYKECENFEIKIMRCYAPWIYN